MKRAVTSRSRADPGNIKNGINFPEPIQARGDGTAHCSLVTDIGGREISLWKRCCQTFAFFGIDADDKHWIFGAPRAGRSGRDSR
jgi:hypothetical protein